LDKMSKVRKSLHKNGLDTIDIDNQMKQVHHALGRRKSGTHHWYGAIVRIDQEPLNGNTLMWRLSARDGQIFHIPVNEAHNIIKIPPGWNQYPNPRKPLNKFIEYRQEVLGNNMINLITYAENRTVDVVPVRSKGESYQFYLIKRRKSGLWATVGGHIEEGELDNPMNAARRELSEETQAYAMVLKQLPGGWVREVVINPELTPSAEYNSWTLPYVAIVHPDTEMKPSDDAVGGAWFDVGDMPSGLHFSHHKKILRQVFEFLPALMKQFGKH
jgi:ADP-ribose pyrophosphatase YjhB (NUDIX family)